MKNLNKIFLYQLLFFLISSILYTSHASQNEFDKWLATYKKYALNKGVSQNTINIAFKNVKFLEKVIGYDRKQPEFFEDTITYVNKHIDQLEYKELKDLLNLLSVDDEIIHKWYFEKKTNDPIFSSNISLKLKNFKLKV